MILFSDARRSATNFEGRSCQREWIQRKRREERGKKCCNPSHGPEQAGGAADYGTKREGCRQCGGKTIC